jgi:chromosomal replication initiator protein
MQDIEQRLLSFQMGTVSRIAPTWLRNKNFYLEKHLISRRCWDSRRNHRIRSTQHQIERKREKEAIISLIAQSSFNKRSNDRTAKSVVEKFVKNVKREISIDYIQKQFHYFQLDLEMLQSKTRKDT